MGAVARSGEPIDMTLPHGAIISKTGLILPASLTEDEWSAVGLALAERNSACRWAIADWWAFGAKKGFKTDQARAAKISIKPETLMNWGSVARKFPTSRRNEALSYSHHAAVVSCDPEEQTRLLTKAEKLHWSVKRLRHVVQNPSDGLGEAPPCDKIGFLISAATRARPRFSNEELLEVVDGEALEALLHEVSQTADQWNERVATLEQRCRPKDVGESRTIERVHFQQAAE